MKEQTFPGITFFTVKEGARANVDVNPDRLLDLVVGLRASILPVTHEAKSGVRREVRRRAREK